MSVVLFLRDLVSEERQCFSCIGLMLNIKFFFSHRSSFVKTLTYINSCARKILSPGSLPWFLLWNSLE